MNNISRKEFLQKSFAGVVASFVGIGAAHSQNPQSTDTVQQAVAQQRANAFIMTPEERKAAKGNLAVTENNRLANGGKPWIDHYSVWDEDGYKVEEKEYNAWGIVTERITYQYDKATGKITEERVYDDKNKLIRVRKYEYYNLKDVLRKKKQFNYNPDGKLYSVKDYEYAFKSK
ncbi:MAG: hypothetical protein LBJ17_06230 [Dysgonamonadaceae bacterium]|jgi:hypothetical protein|nr:hypothetical protein [Dysgonamonadaceae bacterium]